MDFSSNCDHPLELAPFDGQGGLSKMYQLFGAEMDTILDELNEALAA
ncbi:type I restriction-modification enzyme R subunit C-terminal domain-containing protein [Methylomonas sp. DH-1]|nr:type I restriction-modification enzyme R subunit C-terminal domain-containing protein [Methylomonas sp. DH-1]